MPHSSHYHRTRVIGTSLIFGFFILALIVISVRFSRAAEQNYSLAPGDQLSITCQTSLSGQVSGKAATITCAPAPATATPTSAASSIAISGLKGVQEGSILNGQVTIEALVSGSKIRRVEFQLSGPQSLSRSEMAAPYSLFGDSNGVLTPWDTTQWPNGQYTLTVKAFNAGGQSASTMVRFSVANSSTEPTATNTPAPQPTATNTPAPQPTATNTPATGGLHVPVRLSVVQDDQAAILQWDFDPANPVSALPKDVRGYKVTWGPANKPDTYGKLTQHRIMQLQPLINGQPYLARVQAIDNQGRLSAPSTTISFTGDATRVEKLRTQMNGFFDDFNLPEGAADERKWNTAYSQCNGPEGNSFFVNDQFHVHNTIFSLGCDRAQQVNRARTPIDFSDNVTRTIVFDFDGTHRRNSSYVDLVPSLIDISGPERWPAGTLRLAQINQSVELRTFSADGTEVVLASTDWNPYPPLDWAGLELVPNVRRRWELKISKTAAEVFVDGKRVLATKPNAFQLTQNQYHVHWVTFSYNTRKANQPFVLAHWDNFGFDAPAGTRNLTVTHNYKLINSGTDFFKVFAWNKTSPVTRMLIIPDTVTGALARRLMFTLQMADNDQYSWRPSDKITVNGTDFAIPQPPTTPGAIYPISMVIPLPEGVLKQGVNTLVFSAEASSFLNIHVELDFPTASAPAYTSPAQVAQGAVIAPLPAIGPNAVIRQIGSTQVDTWADYLSDPARFKPTVSGVVPIQVQASGDTMLEGTGANLGIVQLELLVDGKVVAAQQTASEVPAPDVVHTFQLDTRQFSAGQHQIYLRAYNANCIASIADYGGAGGQSGQYFPIHVNVQNSGGITSSPPPLPTGLKCSAPAPLTSTTEHQH